jgi:hypothetical protein
MRPAGTSTRRRNSCGSTSAITRQVCEEDHRGARLLSELSVGVVHATGRDGAGLRGRVRRDHAVPGALGCHSCPCPFVLAHRGSLPGLGSACDVLQSGGGGALQQCFEPEAGDGAVDAGWEVGVGVSGPDGAPGKERPRHLIRVGSGEASPGEDVSRCVSSRASERRVYRCSPPLRRWHRAWTHWLLLRQHWSNSWWVQSGRSDRSARAGTPGTSMPTSGAHTGSATSVRFSQRLLRSRSRMGIWLRSIALVIVRGSRTANAGLANEAPTSARRICALEPPPSVVG